MKITFYRTATNSKGTPYRASVITIDLPGVSSKEQALVTAVAQLKEELKVERWQDVAESYDFI